MISSLHITDKGEAVSLYEGITTREKQDNVFLLKMGLSNFRLSNEELMQSGKQNDSNYFHSLSFQSLCLSKSIALRNETNHIEITLSQSEEAETTPRGPLNEESALLQQCSNANQTPMSTLCNYYLKSELSGSKTKPFLIGNLIISEPNAEEEIHFNGKVLGKGSKKNGKAAKKPKMALPKRKDMIRFEGKRESRDKGFLTQRASPRVIEIKCKNKSSSVTEKISLKNDYSKKLIVNTVKRIFHSMKKKPKSSNEKQRKKQITQRKSTVSHEQKPPIDSRRGDSLSKWNSSLEKKKASTSKAPFNPRDKRKPNATTLPQKATHFKSAQCLIPPVNITNESKCKLTRNIVIQEVTENEGETQTAKAAEEKQSHFQLFQHRDNSQATNRNKPNHNINQFNNKKVSFSKKSSLSKKSFCDSNINTTATNKNVSNLSICSKRNSSQPPLNQSAVKKPHLLIKRPISLRKDYDSCNSSKLLIEPRIKRAKAKNEHALNGSMLKLARKHLNDVSLPFYPQKNSINSKAHTERSAFTSDLKCSIKRMVLSSKRFAGSGIDQSQITNETTSSRQNSKERQFTSSSLIYMKNNTAKNKQLKAIAYIALASSNVKQNKNNSKPKTYR